MVIYHQVHSFILSFTPQALQHFREFKKIESKKEEFCCMHNHNHIIQKMQSHRKKKFAFRVKKTFTSTYGVNDSTQTAWVRILHLSHNKK
jgi:hypothetical protein